MLNQQQAELKELIAKSELTPKEQEVWDDFILNATEDEFESVLMVLREDIGMLTFFTENLEAKLNAFQARDKDLAESILKKEKEMLKKLEG